MEERVLKQKAKLDASFMLLPTYYLPTYLLPTYLLPTYVTPVTVPMNKEVRAVLWHIWKKGRFQPQWPMLLNNFGRKSSLELGGTAVALDLSAHSILPPGFESQAHHLCFQSIIKLCHVEKTKLKQKSPGLAHLKSSLRL